MKGITIQELYDLKETIAAELFEGKKLFPGRFCRKSEHFL